MSFLALPYPCIIHKGTMAMMEATITEISPMGKPDIIFLVFIDFLFAGFTFHIKHLTE